MDNLQVLAGVLLVLALWFYVALPSLTPTVSQNFAGFYVAFLLLYTALIFIFVLGYNVVSSIKTFIALAIVFFVFNLIGFPLLIKPQNDGTPIATNSPLAMVSADIAVYSALPKELPHEAKFAITYIIAPALLLLAAAKIGSRSMAQTVKLGATGGV